MTKLSQDRPINIAIIAMGGQGGGVLSKWILDLAFAQGYRAQYTSVPGVAQRTGATIYYIELFPEFLIGKSGAAPVLALTPVPGDVDIVIASEMIEAGRALMRGLVTENTTLIASDHRDYAILEKQELGDGRRDVKRIQELSQKAAKAYICFDMDQAAREVQTVISSVLFGALSGSGALPFTKAAFEDTIKNSQKAVESNLRGFSVGFDRANSEIKGDEAANPGLVKSDRGHAPKVSELVSRVQSEFPPAAHYVLRAGLQKVVNFQDLAYGHLYLDRVASFKAHDKQARGWELTKAMARYMALAMAYDDTAYVADIKTQHARFEEFRDNVKAEPGQIVNVAEYMHPRLEEICDILPASLGQFVLRSKFMKSIFNLFLNKGRRIKTTGLGGFFLLKFISQFRKIRRKSYRFKKETQRIENWSNQVNSALDIDYNLACELAGLQRLIKGYGDTHERGLTNAALIMKVYENFKFTADAAEKLAELKAAALKDEDGIALQRSLASLTA